MDRLKPSILFCLEALEAVEKAGRNRLQAGTAALCILEKMRELAESLVSPRTFFQEHPLEDLASRVPVGAR